MSPSGDEPATAGRLRIRWQHALPVVLVLVFLVIYLAARWTTQEPTLSEDAGQSVQSGAPEAGSSPPASRPESTTPREIPTRPVLVYWPDVEKGALVARPAEVFATASFLDQAKQVVGVLLAGPGAPDDPAAADAAMNGGAGGPAGGDGDGSPDEPDAGTDDPADGADGERDPLVDGTLRAPFPAGTTLRHVFVDPTGTAHVSLSPEASDAAPGGTTWELLAIHSLSNTLVRSFPDRIRRVRILIGDREASTLAGHVDLSVAYGFDEGRVATAD